MKQNPILGLAGVIVAAMSTELNSQVSTIALGDITGHLGLSHDAGAWFTCVYSSAEVVGLATAPWWSVTVTLRRFSLIVIALSCVSTLLIPWCPNLPLLFTLRLLQGLAGGLTIPLLMTTALRVLTPDIRLYGLAGYALTATVFPNLSATMAALWTDVLKWQFIFYQVIPLSALAAVLVWQNMPQDEAQYQRFKGMDWPGMLLVVLGFSSFSTLLSQGDRLDWYHSQVISILTLIAAVCIPLLLLNEWFQEIPLFQLRLLGRRNIAYGVCALFMFLVIGLSASQLPATFLTDIQGYRPLQAHLISLEIAASQLLLLPLVAVLLNLEWLDARILSFVGLGCIFGACIGDSYLSVSWDRNQFYLWQALQSVGDALVVLPLLMISTNSVKEGEGPFASALVNAPRGISEAVGIWIVQLMTRWRGGLHSNRLSDAIGSMRFQSPHGASSSLVYSSSLETDGRQRMYGDQAHFASAVHQQVLVLTLSDTFLVMAGLVVGLAVLLLFLPVRTYPPRIALAKG